MIMSQSEEVQTKVVECAVLGPRGSPSHGEGRGGKRVGDDLRHGRSILSAHIMPNQTRAGLLACSASTIIFGSRRRTRSKGPPPTRVRDRAVGYRESNPT
jgi:hypothetical protein